MPWSKSLEEPDTFVCVEGFRDSDAGASRVGTQAFTDFVARAPDLVAAQPQIIDVDAPDVAGWGADARDPASRLTEPLSRAPGSGGGRRR